MYMCVRYKHGNKVHIDIKRILRTVRCSYIVVVFLLHNGDERTIFCWQQTCLKLTCRYGERGERRELSLVSLLQSNACFFLFLSVSFVGARLYNVHAFNITYTHTMSCKNFHVIFSSFSHCICDPFCSRFCTACILHLV